jgi:hypothetical protein
MKKIMILLLSGVICLIWEACNNEDETIKFAVFSDIHNDLVPDGEKRLQTILDAAKDANVDFIIELGDFCHPDSADNSFLNIWNRFPENKYHVLGNHDMDKCSKEEYIQSKKDLKARYYSFDQGIYHFIVPDANNRFEDGVYIPYHKGGYGRPTSDYVDDEQIEWLKKDLEATDKRFIHSLLRYILQNKSTFHVQITK